MLDSKDSTNSSGSLAGRRTLLRALQELANTQSSVSGLQRFVDRWPKLTERPGSATSTLMTGQAELAVQLEYVAAVRNALCDIWSGSRRGNALLTALFVTGLADRLDIAPSDTVTAIFEADWKRGTIVYRPQSVLQEALYALLQNSRLAKVCANPDCSAPYFIAKKAQERYCSLECAKPFQLQSKRAWWERVGRKRRAQQSETRSSSKGAK